MKKRARRLSASVEKKELEVVIEALPRERVVERMARAFVKAGRRKRVAHDIGFHMADWKRELDTLVAIWRGADDLTDRQLVSFVLGFLSHVPNHVAAAKKLAGMGPIEDIFDVGVLKPDDA